MEQKNISSESLSRIKEILFSDEFQSMETRLNEIKAGFDEKIAESEKKLQERIELLQKESDGKSAAIRKLVDEQKEKNKKLAAGIDQKLKEIKADLERFEKATEDKLETFLAKSHESSKEEIETLKKEIEKSLNNLRETKVDKAEIAELFGMVINKLK